MILILRLLLILALGAFGFAHAAEKRVALVIGNSAYPIAPLANPINDAKDMAAALRQLGFEVIEKTDATQKEMNRAIAQFGEKLRADTVALFFYAGHGMQVKGKNYLIPIDAQIASEASARAETVDVDTVMDQLSVSPLNIVILDACRNNPFERRFRSAGGGLAQMDAPKGSLIAYATAPGKVASDGSGRNGLYTQEILKNIQTPGLDIEKVFKRVRTGVMAGSGDAQTPWESSSLTGDFFFVPGSAAAAPQPATQVVQLTPTITSARTRQQIEDELWDTIKDSDKRNVLEAYLKEYPKGRYVVLAKVKLADLTADLNQRPGSRPSLVATEKAIEGPVLEIDIWNTAKSIDHEDAYRAYLSEYPQGRYAKFALAAIAKLSKAGQKDSKSPALAVESTEMYLGSWTCVIPAGRNYKCYFELTRGGNNQLVINGAYIWIAPLGSDVKKTFSNAQLRDGQIDFQINWEGEPNGTITLRPVSASRMEGTVNGSAVIYATKQSVSGVPTSSPAP